MNFFDRCQFRDLAFKIIILFRLFRFAWTQTRPGTRQGHGHGNGQEQTPTRQGTRKRPEVRARTRPEARTSTRTLIRKKTRVMTFRAIGSKFKFKKMLSPDLTPVKPLKWHSQNEY